MMIEQRQIKRYMMVALLWAVSVTSPALADQKFFALPPADSVQTAQSTSSAGRKFFSLTRHDPRKIVAVNRSRKKPAPTPTDTLAEQSSSLSIEEQHKLLLYVYGDMR